MPSMKSMLAAAVGYAVFMPREEYDTPIPRFAQGPSRRSYGRQADKRIARGRRRNRIARRSRKINRRNAS